MKKQLKYTIDKKTDYFELADKPKLEVKNFNLLITEETSSIEKKSNNINLTSAQRERVAEIKAVKSELNLLRTIGKYKNDDRTNISTYNRRNELIHGKRILNADRGIKLISYH